MIVRFDFVSSTPFRLVIDVVLKEVAMKLARVRLAGWAVLVVVGAMLTLGTPTALAQDATPAAGAEPPHPVHIHSGTCDALGDVVYPLHDIEPYAISHSFSFGPAATPAADSMATPLPGINETQTTPVLFSLTHIDGNLSDLVGGGYAINAHESADTIQTYIACGNIPPCTSAACSAVTGVVIELAPLNDSGYFGVARIDADPNGGSNVAVFLFHPSMPSSS
jgi:hypothetical protein